jgi:hypothetical protein
VEAYARKFDLWNNVHTWEELKNKDISEGKLPN